VTSPTVTLVTFSPSYLLLFDKTEKSRKLFNTEFGLSGAHHTVNFRCNGGGITHMNLILGMDIGVFIAWIGTILAAVLCVLYGVYHELIKKSPEESTPTSKQPKQKKEK